MFKKFNIIAISFLLVGCNHLSTTGNSDEDNQYPKTRDEQQLENMGKLTGEGIVLFGNKNKSSSAATEGINVNSYLWRAALDTIHQMPLISADPFGGTILTDWYSAHGGVKERYKLNIFILGSELRSDALRVTAFKQILDKNNNWIDSTPNTALSLEIEDKILLKARSIKYKAGK